MKYFDEMRDKFGFGDGDSVPDGASGIRTLYITVINLLAEKHGSNFRAFALNRPGMHNWCMICFADLKLIEENNIQISALHDVSACDKLVDDQEYDDAMREAISDVMCVHVDRYVTIRYRVNRNELCKAIKFIEEAA